MSKHKRESKGQRWKRERANKRLAQAAGLRPDVNHLRIDLDSTEFQSLFAVEGGHKKIGDIQHKAINCFGKRPGIKFGGVYGIAVAPSILDIERDKASKLMAQAADAVAIREARERMREEGVAKRVNRLLSAHDRGATGWYRHEVPDQDQRTILMGTNHGKDPLIESAGMIVTVKTETGDHLIGREFWTGGWSAPDENGQRERLGVVVDFAGDPPKLDENGKPKDNGWPSSFHSKKEAQAALLYAIDEGAKLEFVSGAKLDFKEIQSHDRIEARASRLKAWEKNGVDMKEAYCRNRPPAPKSKTPNEGKLVRTK